MLIGGLKKTSLIDYPGHTAAVVFTKGCGFRCPFCHNPDLVECSTEETDSFDLDGFFDFLRKRKHLLDGLVITGGEPTIQADIMDFMAEVKELDYKIKLDTNGSHPKVLEEILKNSLIDFIAMDIKAAWDNYQEAAGVKIDTELIKESISLIKLSNIEYEFRTTAVKPLQSIEDLIQIGLEAGSPYILQKFVNGNLLSSEFPENAIPFSDEELTHVQETLRPKGIKCEVR